MSQKDGKFTAWQRAGYEPAETYWNIATAQDGRTVACKLAGRGVLRVLDEQTGQARDIPVGGSGETFRFGPNNQIYGSIVKFTPAGGAVWFPIKQNLDIYPFDGEAKLPAGQAKVKVDVPFNGGGSRVTVGAGELQGAAWFRYGCSYVLDMHPGHNRRCHCTATEIDVDDFGRVFYTDQGRFRVVVLDTNGNELLTFGGYGNQSDGGKEIAFDWFTGLGATDHNVYVADGGSHRVVRLALKHALEAVCPIR